ncbi:MAG: aspartyl protease family protein [Pseudomonadota bacterium]
MILSRACALLLASTFLQSTAYAQSGEVRRAFAKPIAIDRPTGMISLPLEERGGKLYISALIEGTSGTFIFDTGSPTMLSKDLATQLGLKIIGQNTGVDANGTPVTTEIAVIDEINLGGIRFQNVPVTVFDFASVPMGPCIIGDGIIGSELLPRSAWRIDLDREMIDIAPSAAEFGEDESQQEAPLTPAGYPHMPIVGYSVNGFSDNALFDTGNAGSVVLFKEITKDRQVRKAIKRGSDQRGRGSEGVSAGGMGAEVDLRRFELEGFKIGPNDIGAVTATTRQVPPTLIGTGLLAKSVVVLDYPAGAFRWHPRQSPQKKQPHQGFGVSFVEGKAQVVQLYDGSAAKKAGLKLGDEVLSLSKRSASANTDEERCDHLRWLISAPEAAQATSVTVLRNGQPKTFDLK